MPFILVVLVMAHLLFLHQQGSTQNLGVPIERNKIPFSPYFVIKDFIGVLVFTVLFVGIVLFMPTYLGDPENFLEANPLVTPVHIQPE